MTSLTLKESILAKSPNADQSILDELMGLVEKYNIKWIPHTDGTGAYFIMSQLSVAKGLDSEDYMKHWVKTTTSGKGMESEPLAGTHSKVEGDVLKLFKSRYESIYGEKIGRAPSLYVGNWKRAYAYLVQGTSKAAQDFQSLGANAIEKAVESKVVELKQPEIDRVDRATLRHSGWNTEESLQKDLVYLASMTTFPLTSEMAIEDFPYSKTDVRRMDLIRIQPHKTKGKIVYCFELKKDIIDMEDLINTVEAKQYVELLKKEYNTENIKFVMVAPFGGVGPALERCQAYDNVEIWTVKKMAEFLLERAKPYHKKDSYFVTHTLPVENDTVKKLLESRTYTPSKLINADFNKRGIAA